jgi:two-component system cell cycle response regulator DivK
MPRSDAAPCDAVNEDDEDNRTTNRLRASERRRRLVAVVVDDSEDAQEFPRRALEDCGFIVHQARDGKEALELLIDLPTPSLIVLDLLMPVMNGFELLDIICSYTRLSNVPVLVVSATDQERGLLAPHCSYLRKPIQATELATAVADLTAAAQAIAPRPR